MRPPFFYLPPPHPGCSGILSATRSGTNPPHTHRQSPTRRHKRPTLACPTTSSPAPKPTAHTHLLPRLLAPPSPTDTKKRLPAPEPPPYIRILARTIRPPEPAGKKHPLPATSSTSAPPGKAPPRTSLRPHAPARTREKLRSPPPHIRILAHLHLSPTPCSRAPPKLPLSPPRNARKNVTPHPAGRLPAPSRTSKCLPSPAGTKKAAAR